MSFRNCIIHCNRIGETQNNHSWSKLRVCVSVDKQLKACVVGPWYRRVLLSFCSAILSTCLLSIFEAASYSQHGCWFLAIVLNPSSEEKDLEKHKRGMNANWVNSFSGNSTNDWKWHLIGNSYLCAREAGNKILSWAFFHERENQERKGEWVLAEQPAFSATTGEYTLAKWVCRFSLDWGGASVGEQRLTWFHLSWKSVD